MTKKQRNQLYKEMLEAYSQLAQIDMVVEECAELIQAVNKWKRNKAGVDKLMEEAADVHNMIEQLIQMFTHEKSQELFDTYKEQKLERAQKRLQEFKEKKAKSFKHEN